MAGFGTGAFPRIAATGQPAHDARSASALAASGPGLNSG